MSKMTLVEMVMVGVTGLSLATSIAVVSFLGYGAYKGICAANKYINEPVIQRANVIGNEKSELFIDRDGKRFYAEVDGKPIENYLPK